MRAASLGSLLLLTLVMFLQTLFPTQALAEGWPTPEGELRVAQAGGILKVYSNIKGAKVLLNDQDIGKAPIIRLLPPGKYKVRIEMPGYEVFQKEVEVLTNKAVTVNADLARVVGSVEILCNVEGASVFLEGKEVAKTPTALIENQPAGTYQIQIKKSGFNNYSGTVTIKPNVRLRVKVDLTPNAGQVSMVSTPAGVRVFLDDKEVGVTPLSLEAVEAGRHALRFEQTGYATYYRFFQIEIGQKLEIRTEMSSVAGGLRVRTKYPGADVYLEGNLLGRTPLELEGRIQPGQYSLRISRPGFADYIQPVVIEAKRTTKINAELISLEVAQKQDGGATSSGPEITVPFTRRWWFWSLVGGAVVAAGGTTAYVMNQQATLPSGDIVVGLP